MAAVVRTVAAGAALRSSRRRLVSPNKPPLRRQSVGIVSGFLSSLGSLTASSSSTNDECCVISRSAALRCCCDRHWASRSARSSGRALCVLPPRGGGGDRASRSFSAAAASDDGGAGSQNDHGDDGSSDEEDEEGVQPSIDELLTADEYDPEGAVRDIHQAAFWNQGSGSLSDSGIVGGTWDPEFVREAVDKYERHLRYVLHRLRISKQSEAHGAASSSSSPGASVTETSTDAESESPDSDSNDDDSSSSLESTFQSKIASQISPDPTTHPATLRLLSSHTTEKAFRALTRTNVDTYDMGRRVRELERLIGSIGLTPLTDTLSQRLLEANGKAGNVGRALSLLSLRKARGYPPTSHEFVDAVQAVESAGLYLRRSRNVFLGDGGQPPIDNPTRWLDAILLNMSSRGVQLEVRLANRMLECYAATGRTGRAVHFFYDVVRDRVDDDRVYYGPPTGDGDGDGDEGGGGRRRGRQRRAKEGGKEIPERSYRQMPTQYKRGNKIKVRMKMRDLPPFHKIPSEVRDKLVRTPDSSRSGDGNRGNDSSGGNSGGPGITKLEWERDRSWSPPLTAAFAFADSLTHGACGHRPVELNRVSWNVLISACCNRGALWRAVQIMEETMPKHGIEPDVYTYNTLLAGLARVGDKKTMGDILLNMTNKGIKVHKYTVEALVDGQLNVGDIAGAVTTVQDMFNQHDVLPPYTTHLKILEFALGNDLVYEAKRHVYFIQQLWKWKPIEGVHSREFRQLMHLTKANPKLSKKALKKLFAYFGEELTENDFF